MGDALVVLPKLTLNRLFVSDLIAATGPCFATGSVEVERQPSVSDFLALRLDAPISSACTDRGFGLTHSALGHADRPMLQFTFEFYDHIRYHALVNPSNPIVREVLHTMGLEDLHSALDLETVADAIFERADLVLDDHLSSLLNLSGADLTKKQYRDQMLGHVSAPWVVGDGLQELP